MKRAITLLSLLLAAACASSNDGFAKDDDTRCGPGSPIGIEAGWDTQTSPMERSVDNRMTLLVRVSNSSDEDITVKTIHADPMTAFKDVGIELERGSQNVNKVIAEGEDSTFEIPMMSRRRLQERTTGVRASGVDVTVTVVLDSGKTVRCPFRLPLRF
jgi:hypothetical protein